MIKENKDNKNNYRIDNALEFINKVIDEQQEQLRELSRKAIILNNNIIETTKEIKVLEEKADNSISAFSPIVPEENKRFDRAKEKLEEINIESKELEKLINEKMECINKYINVKYFLGEYIQITAKKGKNEPAVLIDTKTDGIHILERLEAERSRIARDLHDSITQNLTNLVYRADLCTKLLDMDLIRVRLELMSMAESMRSCIKEMREIIYNLRPMAIDDLGLTEAVKRFINNLKENNKIQAVVCVNGNEPEKLPVVTKVTLYRVIQEASNNSIKHSNADTIIVNLYFNKDTIEGEIGDNGCGFDISSVNKENNTKERGHGVGLSTMKERITLLSGKLEIETKPNKGTKIKFTVPVYGSKEENNNGANKSDYSR